MAVAGISPRERVQGVVSAFKRKPAGKRLWVVEKNGKTVKVFVKAQSCFDSFLVHLSNFLDRLVRSKNFKRSAYLISSTDDQRLAKIEAALAPPRPASATDSPSPSGGSGAAASGEDATPPPPAVSPRAPSGARAADDRRAVENEETNRRYFAQQQAEMQRRGSLSSSNEELLERVAAQMDWSIDPEQFGSALRAMVRTEKGAMKRENREWARRLHIVWDHLMTAGNNWELIGASGSLPSQDHVNKNKEFDDLQVQFPSLDRLIEYAQFKDAIDAEIAGVLRDCQDTEREVSLAQCRVKTLVIEESNNNGNNPTHHTREADAILRNMQALKKCRDDHLETCRRLSAKLDAILRQNDLAQVPPSGAAAAASSSPAPALERRDLIPAPASAQVPPPETAAAAPAGIQQYHLQEDYFPEPTAEDKQSLARVRKALGGT